MCQFPLATGAVFGAETWSRTKDACAFNAALYQLSYLGKILGAP